MALKREDINIQFFGMPEFKPEDSYGSCLVIVRDTWELYRAFADGMRAAHGKLLVSGIPRMTWPRKRKNAAQPLRDSRSSIPEETGSGSWPPRPIPPRTKRCPANWPGRFQSAVVMGDSHGYDLRAAQIIDAALERLPDKDIAGSSRPGRSTGIPSRTRTPPRRQAQQPMLPSQRARSIKLSEGDRGKVAETLASLEDLEAVRRIEGPASPIESDA